MPRSHKPRKRYVPKRVDANAHGLALDRITVLDAEQRVKLNIAVIDALVAFRAGHGHRGHWLQLADALNVAEVVAETGIFDGDQPDAYAAAQAALAEVSLRYEHGGSWTLRGTELTAIDQALQCHEIQLDHISQGELHDAIQTVKRRVAGALAGSPPAGAHVCTAGTLGRGAADGAAP